MFRHLEERAVISLLQRADPASPRALRPPYIAAALSIQTGAFGDKAEAGESFESAARRISNIFRNAHNQKR